MCITWVEPSFYTYMCVTNNAQKIKALLPYNSTIAYLCTYLIKKWFYYSNSLLINPLYCICKRIVENTADVE